MNQPLIKTKIQRQRRQVKFCIENLKNKRACLCPCPFPAQDPFRYLQNKENAGRSKQRDQKMR